jgi:hypothetical protein
MRTYSCARLLCRVTLAATLIGALGGDVSAQVLYGGDTLSGSNNTSANGQYRIVLNCSSHCAYQQEEYVSGNWQVRAWVFMSAPSIAGAPFRLTMQNDGNLVFYDKNDSPVDESNTDGYSGAWLNIQNDGNIVIYDSGSNPIWTPYCENSQYSSIFPFGGTCP